MDTELILLLVSIGLLLTGVYLWQKGNHLMVNGKKADAIIFRNNYHHCKSGGLYYPVVRFLTDEQVWITQELSVGYSPAKPEGSRLQVIYDPEDPTQVEVNSSLQLEVLPRLLVALVFLSLHFLKATFLFL